MTIHTIADLPIQEQDPLRLLGIDVHNAPSAPDLEYYGYGYARVDELWLTCADAPEPLPPVRDALLLALHSADDSPPLDNDILLEFWIDGAGENGEDLAITTMLSRFLDIWLPRLSTDERAIVLALCNPQGATIARPRAAGGKPIYHAIGDVTSWMDIPDDATQSAVLRLIADEWQRI